MQVNIQIYAHVLTHIQTHSAWRRRVTDLEGGIHKHGEECSEIGRESIIYIHAVYVYKFQMKPVFCKPAENMF